MRILCPLLIAVSLLCPTFTRAQDSTEPPPEARPFQMSSFNTPFGMQGEFEGEYRIYPDSIEVDVTRAHIRFSTHCQYKGRMDLAAVKLGLGVAVDGQRWDIASASQRFVVGKMMSPGEEYELGPTHFTIPREHEADLSKNWLVATLELLVLDVPDVKQRRGFTYVHTCRDVFSNHPATLSRACS